MGIDKEFSDIKKQVFIQDSRNLKFKDDDILAKKLMVYNYFDLINGFETLFLVDKTDKKKGYIKNTSLNDLLNLYKLDVQLNKEIMLSLRFFEVKLKTSISYHFSEKFCKSIPSNLNYLNKNYYTCPAKTTYSGQYLNKHYNKDTFAFFEKFDQFGTKDKSGTYTYAQMKASKIDYIGRYNSPPLWVIIKQLTFGDLYIMTGLLKPQVLEKVLDDFGLNLGDREYFLNCMDVLKHLRNHCAHFELINRFRTPTDMNLKLIGAKVPISPKNTNAKGDMHRISLYDTLLVLSEYACVDGVVSCMKKYRNANVIKGKHKITVSLLKRMGCPDLRKWKMLSSKT